MNVLIYGWNLVFKQFIKTSDLINRAHDMQTYYEGVAKLRKHNINVCTHIINGLPGEDYEMMMETNVKWLKWMFKA